MTEDTSENLSASFTDLMTSLAVIFILLLVASTNATVHKYEKAKGRAKSDRDKLTKILKDAFPRLDVTADKKDPLGVIVMLPEGLLNFVPDRAEIPEAGQSFLQSFIPQLAAVVCARQDTVHSLVIEGHTDDTGTDLWNVQLSQNRASAVARQTLLILNSHDRADYSCFLGMMSASGRGKNDPIRDPQGQPSPGRSRRVEFHLRVPSLEQRTVEASTRHAAGLQSQATLAP